MFTVAVSFEGSGNRRTHIPFWRRYSVTPSTVATFSTALGAAEAFGRGAGSRDCALAAETKSEDRSPQATDAMTIDRWGIIESRLLEMDRDPPGNRWRRVYAIFVGPGRARCRSRRMPPRRARGGRGLRRAGLWNA